jgi:hypothetical protein
MTGSEVVTLISTIATPMGLIVVAGINMKAASEARDSAQAAGQAAAKTNQTVISIATVTQQVHRVVNSQQTNLLQIVATLSARVARENPEDIEAQKAAVDAAAAFAAKIDADARVESKT